MDDLNTLANSNRKGWQRDSGSMYSTSGDSCIGHGQGTPGNCLPPAAAAIGGRLFWYLHHCCIVNKARRSVSMGFYFFVKKHPRQTQNAEIRQAARPQAYCGEG